MWGCFEKPFVSDTSLDPRPLPSLHMRRRYSALSIYKGKHGCTGYTREYRVYTMTRVNKGKQDIQGYTGYTVWLG